ncbi:hypothetical protein RWE15_08125 [Virgibacillus halophilus]|uniref:Uncharacterized protein n=1 Tax=Tigheibacillus halophilus TaxID=361280 RepID=A0ABU5C5F6_9BACI|nr:hypothetical protein [Virgibacillus halophilus]
MLFEKHGGVGFAGVAFAVMVLAVMFIIPPAFYPAPAHHDTVNAIRYSHFEENPDLVVDKVLDFVFENGKWSLADRYGQTSIVSYVGTIIEDEKPHEVTIEFYKLDDTKKFETDTIIVDGKKLDQASAKSFFGLYIWEIQAKVKQSGRIAAIKHFYKLYRIHSTPKKTIPFSLHSCNNKSTCNHVVSNGNDDE